MTKLEKIKEQLKVCIKGKCPQDCEYIQVDNCWMALVGELLKARQWVSVKDRMPESGKHVLAACEIKLLNGNKKQYICEAYYAKEYSISQGRYPEDADWYDYSEEDDEYYLKEGWYEVIHNWDEYGSVAIDDFVTHWMPLPEPPKEGDSE